MKYLVASLFLIGFLTACGEKEDKKEEAAAVDTTVNVQPRKAGELKIAFYYQDSIATGFEFYMSSEASLQKLQAEFEAEVKRQETAYVNWANAMDSKAKQGLLTDNEIGQLQVTAQQKQQSMAEYQQVKGAELQQKLLKEMEVLDKKISAFSDKFCQENNIDILLKQAPGGHLTYIHGSMDVTKEFVGFLNQEQKNLISGN